ncbi:MAG: urease accessory protein UreD [Pseudomonadota bacterium]|nr:urease accessory protein UreD [Pseudomonadota bacterium]
MTAQILAHQAWHARLELGFVAQRTDSGVNCTILKHRRHVGPLRVQKSFAPEQGRGECHAIMLHPPAGIAGGDALSIQVSVDAVAHGLITTVGAGKWYGSDGRQATQCIHLQVAESACLEWLPLEVMVFDRAQVSNQTQIDLAASASFIGWDVLVFGRQSRGETFTQGRYHNHVQIRQDGRLLLDDRLDVSSSDRWLVSPLGMAGHAVTGAMWAMPPLAYRDTALLDEQILQIRELISRMQMPLYITRLDHLLVARYLGDDARQAVDGFAGIRAKLRRLWFDLDECYPRIWRT